MKTNKKEYVRPHHPNTNTTIMETARNATATATTTAIAIAIATTEATRTNSLETTGSEQFVGSKKMTRYYFIIRYFRNKLL